MQREASCGLEKASLDEKLNHANELLYGDMVPPGWKPRLDATVRCAATAGLDFLVSSRKLET